MSSPCQTKVVWLSLKISKNEFHYNGLFPLRTHIVFFPPKMLLQNCCVISESGYCFFFYFLGHLEILTTQLYANIRWNKLSKVGNKIDLPAREVTTKEASDWARSNGCFYMETSALDGTGVNQAFYRGKFSFHVRSIGRVKLWINIFAAML